MTVHWLDENLDRKSLALACRRIKGHHTHDVLADMMEQVLKEYSIQNKVCGIVTRMLS